MTKTNEKLIFRLTITLIGAIWLLHTASCSKKPREEALEAPSPEVEPKAEPAPQKMIFRGPGEILPKKAESFSITSAPRYFGPENLYDLINGGAEIYVEFGLKEMVTADYKSSAHNDITVTVEIYDQGSTLGAFGRMARFLSEKLDPSEAGQGLPAELEDRGIFGATDLIFFKDHYLAHITLIDESADATLESMSKAGKAILPMFAKEVAAKVASNPPLPAELGFFPPKNRIGRSEAWATNDLAGVRDLGQGFSSRYADGEASWTLFLTDEIEDQKALESKAKKVTESIADEKRFAVEAAGKRLVGFVAVQEAWDEKSRKTATAQVKALKAAASKTN